MAQIIDRFPYRGPAASTILNGHSIRILGLYVPSRGAKQVRNQAKREFQRAVSDALPRFLEEFDGPVIAVGDLNVVEPGHIPYHAIFGEWEYDFYRSFVDAGFVDAYRLLNPRSVEHSWYGRSGQGYRFDHAFISAKHVDLVRSCGYIQEPRIVGITDHAALALTVGIF
jgi:exonuclease III